jgi:hypothetical protein
MSEKGRREPRRIGYGGFRMKSVRGSGIALVLLMAGCAASPPQPPKEVQVNFNFTQATKPGGPKKIERGAISGVPQHVGFMYSVNPDCTSDGLVQTQLKSAPAHGAVAFVKADGYPSFPASSASHDCNTRKSPGIEIVYTSTDKFTGTDVFTVQGVGPHGVYLETEYTVTVIAPPS